jgi:predicted phage tail component-like protein
MYRLKVENKYGEMLELTNNPDYDVLSVTGLNPTNATINTAVLATVDGSLFNSSRTNQRNIVITVKIEGDREKSRINLYRYFKSKQYTKVYFKNETRDIYIEGYVESFEVNQFENGQKAQISILCPRPFLKAMKQIITEFSSVENMFEFEMDLPTEGVEFSSITTDIRKSITNNGEVECGVIMELYALGTVVSPTIYNVQTRESFGLNIQMEDADVIRINTNAGEKSIRLFRNGQETNILNYIDKGSSWFKLASGDNVFTYECESGYEYMQLTFKSTDEFEGV